MSNLRQVYAIQKNNEQRMLKVNPKIPTTSGIYILYRNEIYAYVGQAKNILKRLGQHLSGNDQHIDRSLKAHGLYSKDNPCGYQVHCFYAPIDQLNEKERAKIAECQNIEGMHMLNVTSGGQDAGKVDINQRKPTKSYREGVKYGELKTKREIKELFEKYLVVTAKNEKKISLKKLDQFIREYLEDGKEGNRYSSSSEEDSGN